MKIAITGANGYIGSELVKKCIMEGHDVVAVDVHRDNIDYRATYHNIDIFSGKNDIYELLGKPDVLIHLAWRNGFNHNENSHIDDLSKHYYFLTGMIDSGLKYLSVMGTVHEIGYYEGKVDENTPCNPMSLYGIAKNTLRQMLQIYVKNKNVYFHWLRAYYIIGNDAKSNSVFGKLVSAVQRGENSFPLNSGKNQYDFIPLPELSNQILKASIQSEETGIINVCTGVPKSLGEKIEEFIAENNFNVAINYGFFPDRPYDSPIIYGDNSVIKKIIEGVK